MKFNLIRRYYQVLGILAVCEMLFLKGLAFPLADQSSEMVIVDPVAFAENEDGPEVQDRVSKKRLAFYEDSIVDMLDDEGNGDQPRYKRKQEKLKTSYNKK